MESEPTGNPFVVLASLGFIARRQGFLGEADCRSVLPRTSYRAAYLSKRAEKSWASHHDLWKVIWSAVRRPFLLGASCLVLRGFANAFALPLLLKQIVDAIVDNDHDRAVQYLVILLAERCLGSLLEMWGVRNMTGRVPGAIVGSLGALVARKASRPGVHGIKEAGVDPVALVGRELGMFYLRLGTMGRGGFVAIPTLFAGSITLFMLLGWPALLGSAWVVSTIRVGLFLQTRGKVEEKKMSIAATARLGILSNVLGAIKAIKYFAWEPEFLLEICKVREKECQALSARARWISTATTIGKLTPVTGSLITFVTFALLGNTIKASDIFACNSVFMTMRFSVGASGTMFEIVKSMQLLVSRAQRVLDLPESPPRQIQSSDQATLTYTKDLSIAFESSGFQLKASGELALGRKGTLTAVCGSVGSGKSSLLSALVGAIDGGAAVQGIGPSVSSVGWCPQKPFIISGTILDNILLGRAFDQDRLEKCIADACLGRDLELLQGGLAEVVGDRGTTLSGGQQARLSLARAYYDSPALLLLDDPLAAVDASVGRALLHALRLRCSPSEAELHPESTSGAIMVLNHVQLLPNFDEVLFINDGGLEMFASPSEFESSEGFQKFRCGIESAEIAVDDVGDVAGAVAERQLASRASTNAKQVLEEKPKALVKEQAQHGFVKWAVVREFLFAPGKCFFAFTVLLWVITYVMLALRDWWLGVWADEGGGDDIDLIAGFVAFCFAHILFSCFCVVTLSVFVKRAGQKLHEETISRVLHAPMSFFDETPGGRISSRFGPDLGMMDSSIFSQFDFTMTFGFTFLVMCGTVVAKLPFMAIMFALAFTLSVPIMKAMAIVQQDLRRHSNNAMAPILSNLGEIQRGASLVGVMDCTAFFVGRHDRSVDAWSILVDNSLLAPTVLEAWCVIMHMCVLGGTGALTILNMETLRESPGFVGMYFSYAALWGVFAQVTIMMTMGFLSTMTSLERLLEYKFALAQEPPWRKASDPTSKSWPSAALVCFEDVKLRYRPGLPLALDGFSLTVAGKEKLGIVGRTGAGKSSITSVLFRLVDCEAGHVLIDGLDITTLGVHTLRQAMSMIPQDPIVMSGTVRYNLDPFNKHAEEDLQHVLKEAGLAPAVTLETDAGGGSATLSSGQKQLVTFGRTLLQGTRLVVMDEPTASVDMQTDRLLQIVARRVFAERTVITIAHRLETIKDCDRIAVMEAGRLVELGSPTDLLKNPNSRLALMNKASGVAEGRPADVEALDIELANFESI